MVKHSEMKLAEKNNDFSLKLATEMFKFNFQQNTSFQIFGLVKSSGIV